MAPTETFHDHVTELRHRLLWIIIAVGAGTAVGYVLRQRIIGLVQHPLRAPLFYTSPAGSFNFVLKIAGMVGVIIALPLICYHLIRFIEPALPGRLRPAFIILTIVFSTLLALAGAAFGFFVMVPMSLHFFSTYSTAIIKPLISADEYLSFVIGVIVTFGLFFQIPLIIAFINRIKPLSPKKLLRHQKLVIAAAFGIAIILPFTYDPISQFIMAVPIVFLYYISVIVVWVANRRRPINFAPEPIRAQPSKPAQTGLATRRQRQRPATVMTAFDVVKPRRLSSQPVKPNQPTGMRVNPNNLIDLSGQS